MNYWVIALPFLLYLASFGMYWGSPKANRTLSANATDTAMGIAFIYQIAGPNFLTIDCSTPYYSISASLNVLLTLMILARLVRHSGNVRKAIGASTRIGGLCKTAATLLVESFALYAVSYILFIGPWGANSGATNIFFPILVEAQVRAVLMFL